MSDFDKWWRDNGSLDGRMDNIYKRVAACAWNAALQRAEEVCRKACDKCGGAGWLRGIEIDDADEATAADTMTKYSCDSKVCECARAIAGLRSDHD